MVPAAGYLCAPSALGDFMKCLLALLGACMLCGVPALAGTLSEQDVAKVKADIDAMYQAIEKGDATLLLANTHESAYALAGGDRETFEKVSREAMQQLLQAGVKFLSAELGVPTSTYPAGEEEVCFIPRISVAELQGKKVKLTGFMIAIRPVGGTAWKYLDGSPLRKNPELLQLLLPELTTDVELPPNTAELM
jgi:hypothetical protein